MSDAPVLLLVEPTTAPHWTTFTATRPLADIHWGRRRLAERVAHAADRPCGGVVAPAHLTGFDERDSLPVRALPERAGPEGLLLWASAAAPTVTIPVAGNGSDVAYLVEGRVAGRYLAPGREIGSEIVADFGEPATGGDVVSVEGVWLEAPWQLIGSLPDRLGRDLEEMAREGVPAGYARLAEGRGVHVEGTHPVWAAPGVEVGPGVAFDTRDGAVLLERGVRVQGPARLIGPLQVGRDSLLYGGPIGRSVIGPVCKLRGEISDCLLLGWTNKAHEGHLGHALLGRWVNLGAGTTNSDLRNDYGEVRIALEPQAPRVATGHTKVGAFLGDHVKTGIGTLLTTGAVIGVGSQVAGGGLAPTPLPPFSWVTPDGAVPYRIDRFESTMETVMARRDRTPTPGMREILRALHGRTHGGADQQASS